MTLREEVIAAIKAAHEGTNGSAVTDYEALADAAISIVLERAAGVAEAWRWEGEDLDYYDTGADDAARPIAEAIRALAEQGEG